MISDTIRRNMHFVATLILSLLLLPLPALAEAYYRPVSHGSESLYSPFSNFLSYSFDALQIPGNFDIENFSTQSEEIFYNLAHPNQAIQAEGGYRRFINRQVFPVYPEYYNESYAALPNYFLHLLGGGMVYRRDLEWLRQHEYEQATASAVALAMTAEVLQEIIEKKTATEDDAIADIYLFRPVGILLFHNEAFARAFMRHLQPAIWPSLQAVNITNGGLSNTGLHYIYRPPALSLGNAQLFVYTGMNNLFGLSHRFTRRDRISWGVGKSIQKVDLSLKRLAILDTSYGLFYDRDKSLLASLVINDTGAQRFRFNLYPFDTSLPGSFGYFLTQDKAGEFSAGLIYQVQLGIGFSFK